MKTSYLLLFVSVLTFEAAGQDNIPRIVEVPVGSTVTINFPLDPQSGHNWRLTNQEVVGKMLLEKGREFHQFPGSTSGETIFTFDALHLGKALLKFLKLDGNIPLETAEVLLIVTERPEDL